MTKIDNYIIIVILLALIACNKENKREENLEINSVQPSIEILSKIDTLTDLRWLFNEKKIILSSSKMLVMGRIGYIYDLDLQGNFYLASGNEVYKFNKDGKYLNILSKVGKGPGEYSYIDAICLDNSNNLFVFDGTLKIINIYDNDFEFIGKIEQKSITPISSVAIGKENLYVYCPLDRTATIYQYNIENKDFVRSFGQVDSLSIKYRSNFAFSSITAIDGTVYYMLPHKSIMYIYDKQLKQSQIKFDLNEFLEIKQKRKSFRDKRKYSFIHRFDIFQNLFFIQAENPNVEYPIKGVKIDLADFNGNSIKEQLLFSGILAIKKVSERQFMSVKYPDVTEGENSPDAENPYILLYTLKDDIE